MDLNIDFNVIARCRVFMNGSAENEFKEDVELTFNANSAEKFLFRFYEPILTVDGFKLMFKYNNRGTVEGIILYKDNSTYIITNPNQLINEVLKGYYQIKSLYTISDIMSFDFEAANLLRNEQIAEDEFE
jgi:hypothetical protein